MTRIEEKIKLNDIVFFQYSFETPNKEINKEEKITRLHRIIEDKKIFTVEEIVEILKTIYQDKTEETLTITMSYSKDNTFKIHYKNGYLDSYTHEIISKKEEKKQEAKYEEKEIKFTFSSNQLESSEDIPQFVKEERKRIHKMKNMMPITLTINEERISRLYQLFYNQNPDFSENETCEKAQYMIAILENYQLSPFLISKEELKNLERLAPLGEIKKCNIILEKEPKEKIEMIGATIQEELKMTEQEELNGIKALYSALNSNPTFDNDINSLQFIKRIDNKLKQNMYKVNKRRS